MKEPAFSSGGASTVDNEALGVPLFKDPSEYDHMTDEEKDELTNKMLQAHRAWSSGKLKG